METHQATPDTKQEKIRLFSVGGEHSRNLSLSSLVGDDSQLLLAIEDKSQSKDDTSSGGTETSCWKWKINGSCVCKLSIVFYLAVCVLISALYVAFFGKNQAIFGDAWIPGKPTVNRPSHHQFPTFQDLPYTEWVSQRWTYHVAPFADWPTLPPEVDHIQQVLAGKMAGSKGLWLLTFSQLFFVRGLYGGSPEEDVAFLNISQKLELDISPNSYIVSHMNDVLYLITPDNVTYLDCLLAECEVIPARCPPPPFTRVLTSAFSLSDNTLWLGTPQGLFTLSFDSQQGFSFTNFSEVTSPVQTLAWRSAISYKKQNKRYVMQSFIFSPLVGNQLQETFACSNSHGIKSIGSFGYRRKIKWKFGVLVVGTSERLYFYDGTKWWFEWVSIWENGLGGVIDGVPTAMTFGPSGELYIANNISLTRVNINYTFDRIGPLDGLPYNELLSLHVSPYTPLYPPPAGPAPPPSPEGTLWIGTMKGYTLFDIQESKFKGYFYGPRWHPRGGIWSISESEGSMVLLTDEGLAVVSPEVWTLAKKAQHYQAMLGRHTRDPGLVADCPLKDYNVSTCIPVSTESDGIWTAWAMAAEAFRYHVTKNYSARINAWNLFSGLHFLVNVTDIKGLIARSAVSENISVEGENWHDSAGISGWQWLGDTSSDTVVGHMFAYPIIYDLVAEGEEEKKEVEELLGDVVGYIMENQFKLVDVGNRTTRWGMWTPSQLNYNQSWSEEHGLNSLQMLSFLLSAYRISKDPQFLSAWQILFSEMYEDVPTHYGLNSINQKILFPRDNNFSDDELSFLSYFIYFHSLKKLNKYEEDELGMKNEPWAYGRLSLDRTWRTVRKGRSSAWTTIFAYAADREHEGKLLEELVWNLRTWPLELIQWSTHNSHRLDIRINPEQDRNWHSGSQSVEVLPANERTQLRWNANPFQLDWTGLSNEMDPAPWLMPYWMARWSEIL